MLKSFNKSSIFGYQVVNQTSAKEDNMKLQSVKTMLLISSLFIIMVTLMNCKQINISVADGRKQETRAVWVTRWEYKTAEDVKKIFKNLRDHNFTDAIFQVRGNATVFYKSDIEPWAYELTSDNPSTIGKDPGWDPLQTAIDAGRENRIKVQAWVNVYPGWRFGKELPANIDQLWNTHQDWFMVGKDGKIMTTDSWYSFLNPANPEVKDYLIKIFEEIVRRYDIDAIHYDYIRYPGEIGDFSYDEVSLKRFKEETGKTPDEAPELWTEWRCKQVTELVQSVYDAARKIRPFIKITAAVSGDYKYAINKSFQPSREWAEKGLVNALIPMNYTKDMELYKKKALDFYENTKNAKVLMGIIYSQDAEGIAKQIEFTREQNGGGFVLFSYSGFFENHQPNKKMKHLMETVLK